MTIAIAKLDTFTSLVYPEPKFGPPGACLREQHLECLRGAPSACQARTGSSSAFKFALMVLHGVMRVAERAR